MNETLNALKDIENITLKPTPTGAIVQLTAGCVPISISLSLRDDFHRVLNVWSIRDLAKYMHACGRNPSEPELEKAMTEYIRKCNDENS
jgi:hypothetical protein